jgi:hypothetical protein
MGIWNIYPHVNVYIDTEKPPVPCRSCSEPQPPWVVTTAPKIFLSGLKKLGQRTSPNSLGQRIPSGLVRYGISWYIHIYPYIYISHMRFSSTTLPQDQVVSVTITFGSLIPHF